MKYALLIYEDESQYGPEKAGPRVQEIAAKHMAFTQQLGAKRIGGAGLKGTATATTVHTKGGKKTVHDGPFAEAREQLGGLYLVDVASLDEAIEIAKRIPLRRTAQSRSDLCSARDERTCAREGISGGKRPHHRGSCRPIS